MAHQQCADTLAPLEGSCVVLTQRRRLAIADTAQGRLLLESPALPFDVYRCARPVMLKWRFAACSQLLQLTRHAAAALCSLSVEPELGWIVAAGCERTAEQHNVGLLRVRRNEDGSLGALLLVRTFGVGRLRHGSRDQANSVRFGVSLQPQPPAGGTEAPQLRPPLPPLPRVRVLLVGSQDKSVYVLPVPPPQPDGSLPAGNFAPRCTHRFPTAINCAAASPDGRWLAATGDLEEVYLVGGGDGFLDTTRVTIHVLRLDEGHTRTAALDPRGCQYVAWSCDSARLAVSSDTLNAVAVWAVPPDAAEPPTPWCRISQHDTPVLPLAFLPGSHKLAYAEAMHRLYVADVDVMAQMDAWRRPLTRQLGSAYLQRCALQRLVLRPAALPVPQAPQLWEPPQHRITGLCASADGHLLAALQRGICQFRILGGWSRELHAHFPAAFRAAARALLLCAGQPPPPPGQPPALASLPPEIVLHIIALAATPQTDWLPPRLSPEEEMRLLMSMGYYLDDESDEEFYDEGDGDEDEDEE